MDRVRILVSRIAAIFRRGSLDASLDEEFRTSISPLKNTCDAAYPGRKPAASRFANSAG
jgi:hypothetical protein